MATRWEYEFDVLLGEDVSRSHPVDEHVEWRPAINPGVIRAI
jgi:hypothetical protein